MSEDETTKSNSRIPVLEMRDVTLRESGRESRLRRVDFSLFSGQLAFILRPTGPTKQLLPGGAAGLIKPRRGEVRFNNIRWASADKNKQRVMRAKIGRVFDHSGWLQNLSVIDNILLAQRHHTDRTEHELFAHARSLVSELGIAFPDRRPAFVEASKLRIYQWVRALICQPLLLIAERPFAGVPHEQRSRVFAVEKRFRERGGATVWVTDNRNLWNKVESSGLSKYEIIDERLVLKAGAVA
jgi:phospholipid/cholesterol/gamma-HCH transport system ATP-binding protein